MPQSESIAELTKALIAAQRAMGPAIKTETNPHFRSKYVDLAGAWDACRDALLDNGLTVIQTTRVEEGVECRDAATNKAGEVLEVASPLAVLVTTLVHESGEFVAGTYPLRPARPNDPQALGAALTYARRYCLMAAVGLAPEDDDGQAASTPADRARVEAPRAAPARSRPADAAARTWDELLDRVIRRWHAFDPIPDARERTAREHRVAHHLVTAAIADELVAEERVLQPVAAGHEPARSPAKVWACVKWLWGEHPDWVRRACREYLAEKEAEARAQSEALAN